MISKNKNNNLNTIVNSFGAGPPFKCSAGQMRFIPLPKKAETTNKDIRNYLNSSYDKTKIREIYDSLRFKLIKIIDYLPKIV